MNRGVGNGAEGAGRGGRGQMRSGGKQGQWTQNRSVALICHLETILIQVPTISTLLYYNQSSRPHHA